MGPLSGSVTAGRGEACGSGFIGLSARSDDSLKLLDAYFGPGHGGDAQEVRDALPLGRISDRGDIALKSVAHIWIVADVAHWADRIKGSNLVATSSRARPHYSDHVAHIAYTVDRRGTLQPGMTMNLVRHQDVQPAALQEYVDGSFPNGVSEHGESYLLKPAPATLLDPIVELACELVRRADFPELPSRFASVFGCATLEDAHTFRSEFGLPDAPIFEVETSCMPLRLDMRCLDIRSSILVTAYGARRYWSRLPNDLDVFPGAQSRAPLWELLLAPPVHVVRQVG